MTHIRSIILIQKYNPVTQYHIVRLHTVSLPSLSKQLTFRIHMIQSIVWLHRCFSMHYNIFHLLLYNWYMYVCMYRTIKCQFNRLVTEHSLKGIPTNSTLSIANSCTQGTVGFDTVPFYKSQLQSTHNKLNHYIL